MNAISSELACISPRPLRPRGLKVSKVSSLSSSRWLTAKQALAYGIRHASPAAHADLQLAKVRDRRPAHPLRRYPTPWQYGQFGSPGQIVNRFRRRRTFGFCLRRHAGEMPDRLVHSAFRHGPLPSSVSSIASQYFQLRLLCFTASSIASATHAAGISCFCIVQRIRDHRRERADILFVEPEDVRPFQRRGHDARHVSGHPAFAKTSPRPHVPAGSSGSKAACPSCTDFSRLPRFCAACNPEPTSSWPQAQVVLVEIGFCQRRNGPSICCDPPQGVQGDLQLLQRGQSRSAVGERMHPGVGW